MPEASDRTSPLRHLSSLYQAAQVLTGDARQAARLVKAAYRRAAVTSRAGAPPQDRLDLLRHLTTLARTGPSETPATDALLHKEAARGFRDRMATRVLNRALPVVFATLPAEDRLLLILCRVEGYACADAGRALNLSAETARARLERTEAVLRRGLHENARPAERVLLEALPEKALHAALRRMAGAEFSAPPPDLQEEIQEAHSAATRRLLSISAEAAGQEATEALVPHDSRSRRRGGSLRRMLAALLIITLAGGTGYFASHLLKPAPEANVVALSARAAGQPRLTLQTSRPAAAEQFVHSRLGQRLDVPAIDRAALHDVSIVEVAPGVPVPVFSYEDADTGRPLTVYAYTYALLERHPERLHLDSGVLQTIVEEAHPEVRHVEDRAVVIWRHRDEIFVAVARGDTETLRERLPL